MIVDVFGIEAFLPGSQLDVIPIRNPEEHVGKTYEFRILKINLDRKNIVVSRRELIEESRKESRRKVMSEIQVGQLRPGVVKNITDFGAFVDIGLHDSGLVHVSQLSSGFIRDPYAAVVVGQSVKVWVLELDKTRRRVALTMIKPGTKPVHGASRGRSQNSRKKFAANSTQKKSAEKKGSPSGRGQRKPGAVQERARNKTVEVARILLAQIVKKQKNH